MCKTGWTLYGEKSVINVGGVEVEMMVFCCK